MFEKFLSELVTAEPVLLNITELPRGIDNYHIDVKLSPTFITNFNTLLNDYLTIETSQKQGRLKNEKQVEVFKESYADMMTVLIHRIKSDLSQTEVNLLQFAIYRFILESSQNALDSHIKQLRTRLTESHGKGSGKALVMQEQLIWLTKHYSSILYAVNRQIFTFLRQVETKVLQPVRRQYLAQSDEILLEILANPMLLTSDLDSANFLIEKYLLWNKSSDSSEFPSINSHIESIFRELLPDAPFHRLVDLERPTGQLEIYDDLGGLSACKNVLGPSPDTKNFISEDFTWMETPANFEYLFDEEKLRQLARKVRREQGLKAWWRFRGDMKRLRLILKRVRQFLDSKKLTQQLAASRHTRKMWSRQLAQYMEPLTLCRFLGGELQFKDFQKRVSQSYQFSPDEVKAMNKAAKDVKDELEDKSPDLVVKFLAALSLYRLHLKHYRFAHRVFNRISILADEDKLRLSSQAGTLYQLPMAAEVKDDEARIVHHAILKADVRGSTTVTDELEKKGLNPASYFSLRFFGPINKVLSTYGAGKVFIEGDAVILSFLEYEHSPQHWLAVARACGMAKAMLSVVNANNKYSKQMDLPPIELGIGVCFANYPPRYLYDGETPIMISSAIGEADRMSSCSWKLRAKISRQHPFNVEVLEIAPDDDYKGEKGQEQIRYNVNGILLENEAFDKLRNEMAMTRLTGQVEGKTEVFWYGEYPDTEGKKRTLVIREGKVGLWKNDSIQPYDSDEKFYEVVTNAQITASIQKKMHTGKPEETPRATAS